MVKIEQKIQEQKVCLTDESFFIEDFLLPLALHY